jgi:peptidoglycan/LPS O-acetylase OafA/YrhL
VAALIVVVSHYMDFGLIPKNTWFLVLFNGGGIAVTYFFALSGFILAHNYRSFSQTGSTRAFYIARVARIYPVLVASIVFSVLILKWIPTNQNQDQSLYVPASTLHTILASFGQVTGLGTWFPFSAVQSVLNAPAWSVGCEIFFYLIFPYLINCLCGKYSPKRYFFILVPYFATLMILGLYIFNNSSNRSQLLLGRFPILHLIEFIAGVVAYRFVLNKKFMKNRFRAVFLSSSMCILALVVVQSPYSFLLLGPLFAFLIASLAIESPKTYNGRVWRLLVLLGESSYALYLVHFPIGILLISSKLGLIMVPISLVLVTALSVLVHQFYEVPSREWIIRNLTSINRKYY